MSRTRRPKSVPGRCFPRVSGDEPAREGVLIRAEQFSPRERG